MLLRSGLAWGGVLLLKGAYRMGCGHQGIEPSTFYPNPFLNRKGWKITDHRILTTKLVFLGLRVRVHGAGNCCNSRQEKMNLMN